MHRGCLAQRKHRADFGPDVPLACQVEQSPQTLPVPPVVGVHFSWHHAQGDALPRKQAYELHPRRAAHWLKASPTPPLAPWMSTVSPLATRPCLSSTLVAVR